MKNKYFHTLLLCVVAFLATTAVFSQSTTKANDTIKKDSKDSEKNESSSNLCLLFGVISKLNENNFILE